MKYKFYRCNVCGRVVSVIDDSEADLICCNIPMERIEAQTKEEKLNREKHLPVYRIKGNRVIINVGDIPHPSTPDHYIKWIAIKTNLGFQQKYLKPGDQPRATFLLDNDEILEEVYSYCNIHSLWKVDLQEDCCECDLDM